MSKPVERVEIITGRERRRRYNYVRVNPCPDALSVLRQLPAWFEDLYEGLRVNRGMRGCSAAIDMRGTRMDLYPAGAAAPWS